jgi:cell surface protein SprA
LAIKTQQNIDTNKTPTMNRILILLTFKILLGLSFISCEKSESENNPIYPQKFSNPTNWKLASTPARFPESALSNDLSYGYNRAKLAWYSIDPMFLRNAAMTPDYVKYDKDLLSSHLVREIFEREIFPDSVPAYGVSKALNVLNLAYYPAERGPYNYDSENVNVDGEFTNPDQRWSGIISKIESANSNQYIEFWLMDPFIENNASSNGGDLYINLGRISEDILKDSRKSFEDGLHIPGAENNIDTTNWGIVSRDGNSSGGFLNYLVQDVGLDGLNSNQEMSFFSGYINQMSQKVNSTIFAEIAKDPSSDDYHSVLGSDFDILQTSIIERYKNHNNHEGNFLTDNEDISNDNKLNFEDAYREFKISLRPDDMNIGQNFIVDKLNRDVNLANQTMGFINWYHFKIPIEGNSSVVGNINSFDHFECIRLYLTNFESPIVLRLVEFGMKNEEAL